MNKLNCAKQKAFNKALTNIRGLLSKQILRPSFRIFKDQFRNRLKQYNIITDNYEAGKFILLEH